MSLINDALKKAQKQQTQQPASSAQVSPFSAPKASRPGVVMSFERLLLLVVTLVVVIVGATAVGVLLVRKDDRPVVANRPHPSASEPAVATAGTLENPVAPAPPPATVSTPVTIRAESPAAVPVPHTAPGAPATATETAMVMVPVITASPAHPPPATVAPPSVSLSPTAAPVVSVSLGPTRAPVSARVTPTPPPAIAPRLIPTPPAVPTRDPRILSFLENAKVGGIRFAGDDSKVVLNDHVYRVNNVVNLELGLRLTAVSATTLTFVDENGFVYTKTF